MSQSAPAPVLVTEDLLPELVGKLIVMVDTENKSGLDVGNNNEEKIEPNINGGEEKMNDKVAEDTTKKGEDVGPFNPFQGILRALIILKNNFSPQFLHLSGF